MANNGHIDLTDDVDTHLRKLRDEADRIEAAGNAMLETARSLRDAVAVAVANRRSAN